jgi:hypothetical protein
VVRFFITVGALVVPLIVGFAVWDASKRGSMAMGEVCEEDKYCESGLCVAAGNTRLCAEMCSGQCRDGFTCVPTEAPEDLGTVYYYCLPSELAPSHTTPEPEAPVAVSAMDQDEREEPIQGQGVAVQKVTKRKRRANKTKRRKRRRRKLSKAGLLRRR